MNVHVSPAAIAARRPNTTDLDAKLKTAILAHGATVRVLNKRRRELRALTDRHPDLADPQVSVAISVTEFAQIAALSPAQTSPSRPWQDGFRHRHDFYTAFGVRGEDDLSRPMLVSWQSIKNRIDDARPAYEKARRAAGLPRAESGAYEALRAEKRAFENVLRISPATRSGCRIVAKFLLSQLPRAAGGPLSYEAARTLPHSQASFSFGEMHDWSLRRSFAYDCLAKMLHRLAE